MHEHSCLDDFFYVQIADVEDTTEGGLLMAGSSKEKPTLGTVHKSTLRLCAMLCMLA